MKPLITAILTLSFGLLQAQKFSAGFEGYMGSFDMSSLKQYQANSENNSIPFKTVQNFPIRPGVRIVGSYSVDRNLSTGILLGMISTGGRLAYSDFTGAAYRDVTVNGFQFGSFNRYTFFNYKKLSLTARMTFGGIANRVKFDHHIHLVQPVYEERHVSEWQSVNFYSDLGLEAGYTFDRFLFKIFSSYEFSTPSEMKLKTGDTSTTGGQTFDVSWNGFRAGVGIEYKFWKQE